MIGTIERVVVALDAVSENRAAIEAAARLAARWKAPLHGVFVKDDDLLRLAGLPFARQVSLGTGVETVTVPQAERQLRVFAERARREVTAAARRHGVEASFEIVRGTPTGSAATTSTDFIVAGPMTRPIGGHFRVESRWWSTIPPASASFLLTHRDWDPQGAIVVLLHNRAPAAERLLDAAAHFAEQRGGRLVVIIDQELVDDDGFEAWLGERLAHYAVRVEIDLAPSEPAALVGRIVELDCQVVAIEAGASHAHPDRLRELVARIACDVLVVR
jgi:nucleotide-binding universal stress UspA family protein